MNDLKIIIRNLNKHRKIVEAIKKSLDKLFIYEGIEKYFFGLLDKFPNEKFPEKFYRAMLWLHGEFLNAELPSNLNVKKLSDDLNKNFQRIKNQKDELDNFFKASSNEQVSQLKELAEKSILKKLLNETKKELSNNFNCRIEHYDFIQKKLLKYFQDFEKLDTVLYPLDYLAGIPEKQLIETFRISPEDAKLGLSSQFNNGERLDKKLAGDTLNAFGGFFKKSWRANDILWGRLDGLNRIVEALVTEDKIKNFPKLLENEAKTKGLKPDEYLDRLLEEALVPASWKSEKDKEYWTAKKDELKGKIENLLKLLNAESSGEKTQKDEQLSKEIKDLVESLVFAGHLVILDEDFNDTMQVSIEEQLTKEQLKKLEKPDETPKFNPKTRSFNSRITTLAVRQLADQSLATMSLKEKKCFFYDDYKVGSETLEDIPKSELKNIILRSIIIIQDIINTWQHKTRTKSNSSMSNNSASSRPRFWNHLGFRFADFMLSFGIHLLKIWLRFF